jgi:anhydro-N-acetylmuramic acid kinase
LDYSLLDISLGQWMGKAVNEFITKYSIDKNTKIDFISSHGHTIFHQPALGLTTQIGNGAKIAAITQLPVVCDFRKLDVALGGQGAPLVPIGDELLFPEYDVCVNLGGIANISATYNGKRLAFDATACNMVLNYYAQILGKPYDEGGKLALKGALNAKLLAQLNQLPYYQLNPPKSIGKEWVMNEVMPLMIAGNALVLTERNDYHKLHTFTEHVAQQVANAIDLVCEIRNAKILVTGGGAFNHYLIYKLHFYMPTKEIIVPEDKIVKFKEALIFGFLGILRWRNEKNCLESVTGASHDHSGGAIWMPSKC